MKDLIRIGAGKPSSLLGIPDEFIQVICTIKRGIAPSRTFEVLCWAARNPAKAMKIVDAYNSSPLYAKKMLLHIIASGEWIPARILTALVEQVASKKEEKALYRALVTNGFPYEFELRHGAKAITEFSSVRSGRESYERIKCVVTFTVKGGAAIRLVYLPPRASWVGVLDNLKAPIKETWLQYIVFGRRRYRHYEERVAFENLLKSIQENADPKLRLLIENPKLSTPSSFH